jgi:hypothetical protein
MKPPKTPQQKLESELVVALQTALDKPLTRNQAEQVTALADDLASNNKQALNSLNQGLQSLLEETGLKASTLGPVTALVASYPPIGSSAHGMVGEAIGKFEEVHKVELAQAKANDFLGAVIKDLGGSSRLDDFQAQKVAELTSSLKNIGDPDGPARFSKALEEFVEMAPGHVSTVSGRIEGYHKNDPAKQALVSPVLESVKANDFLGAVIKDLGGSSILDDFQMQKVAELTSSLKNIGDPDGPARFSKALEEFAEIAPGQVGNITARIEGYHKNEPTKQALVSPVLVPFKESIKANELNKQITTELEGIAGRKLDAPELLMVAELSQSVAHIRDKDDLPTLTKYLDNVVKNLTPEQAQPILDLVNEYHENDPTKQALVSPVVENVTFKKPEVEVALDTMGLVSNDEITQSIRDNIIIKQQAYLQGEIAKTMSVEDGVDFNKKTPEEIRAYLGTEEGRAATKEVMKTKEAQSAMNKIEVEGYREVHKIESFRNVEWAQETGTKVRIAEIKNDVGDIVASLKETTVNAAPTQVTLEDGTTRTVKSYRQIDFPTNPKDIKGPAHFSMAVKDENGNNISAKDAVYFTAHYDDDGKLTEVSSPVPVKFMGDGDDAIGYIERNGKVYTLPVTQGKYKEMMQQVAINNGLSVDLGQAVDSVSIPPRTVEPRLDVPHRPAPKLHTAKIVNVEPIEMQIAKIVNVEPIELQTAKIINVEPIELHTAQIVTIEPVPKTGPDQVRPLTDSQQFEAELRTAKAGLTKTDRGAEVYGYEKPKSGPDQEKPLTDSQQFEEQLKAAKAGLTKTDRGAEVYGYEKPKSGPELTEVTPTIGIIPKEIVKVAAPKLEMGPIIETVTITSSVTLDEPKPPKLVMGQAVETVLVTLNPITGVTVSPEVIQKAQEIKNVVLGISAPKSEVDKDKEALAMLKDKTPEQALKAISNAIGKGDDKLVKAMMGVIFPADGKPIEGVPAVGRMALAKVYTDQMESTKGMKLDQDRSKVQRAAGAIADKAGIADHEKRMTKPKASQQER